MSQGNSRERKSVTSVTSVTQESRPIDCWNCKYFEYNPLSKRYLCYLPLCLGLSPYPKELSVSDILKIRGMVRGCDGFTPRDEGVKKARLPGLKGGLRL